MNRFFKGSGADFLVLLAALIWGVAFYFQKTAMSHIGPLLFLGLRSIVGAVALLPFAWREQRRVQPGRASVVPVAIVGGLVFFVAAAIQQIGIVSTTVINTGLLTALYVVATPFVFWVVERQAPPGYIWVSVVLSFLGVWGLSGGSLAALSRGDLFVACAALVWGVHIVVTGRAGRLAQPLTYTCMQFFVVAALALTLAVAFEPISLRAVVGATDSILYVGLLSSAFTFGLMAVALQHIPAPRASTLLSVEVLFSALAGYVLLGERLSLVGWAGGGLIALAVLLVRARGT